MQRRILPEWRYDEAEEQRNQHEDSRKDNLKQNAAIIITTINHHLLQGGGWTLGCVYLSKEAPPAPTCIKPAFDEKSPQLLPGQPPADCWSAYVTIDTQRVRFLRFCGSEFPVRLMVVCRGLSQRALYKRHAFWTDYHYLGTRSHPEVIKRLKST